jgi:hypothetical protein
MGLVAWLVAAVAVFHGIIAGMSFDVAMVKLPTRRRIGAVAYAQFARGNDLGNGLVVYPAMGITAVATVLGTTLAAVLLCASEGVLIPLLASCAGTIAHSLCTAGAAPIMLSLKRTPDNEKTLAAKLDRFAAWHAFRAVFQALTFVALVWALVAVSRASM